MFRLGGIAWRVSRTLLPLPLPVLLTNTQKARGGGVANGRRGRAGTEKGRMCLRYDFRNQNSARIGINLLPNVIKLFSDRTCIFHARSFPCSRSARVLAARLTACLRVWYPAIQAPHFDFLLLLRYLILLILIEIYAAIAVPGRPTTSSSACCHYISNCSVGLLLLLPAEV